MKKLWLVLAVLALLLIGTVCASDTLPPRLPCTYFGNVLISGTPAPVGTVITAKVDGVDLIGSTTVTTTGKYESLSVQNNFGTVENPQVTFFVNGIQATQIRTFEKGAAIKVDLTFSQNTATPVTTTTEYKTTKIIGSIHATPPVVKSVVITPPTGTVPWDLSMSGNNEITIGSVHIVANCDYTLYIRGSTGGYLIGEQGAAMTFPTLKNPVLVFDGTTFNRIEKNGATQLAIYNGHAGTVDVPIKLQQILTSNDVSIINPTIVLSYDYTIL